MAKETNQNVEQTPPIVPAAETAAASGPIGAAISASDYLADGEQLAPAKTTIVDPA